MSHLNWWFSNRPSDQVSRKVRAASGPPGCNLAQLPALADGTILAQFDPWFGGFGPGPKQADGRLLTYTVERYCATGLEQWREVFGLTLDAITRCLFDETEGAFYAGSPRRDWGDPYPEKPLDVCADVTLAYLAAYRATGRVSYAEVATRSLRCLAANVEVEGPRLGCLALASATEALSIGLESLGADEHLGASRAALNELERRLQDGMAPIHCATSVGALVAAARALREDDWLACAELAARGLRPPLATPVDAASVRLYALSIRPLVELALASGREQSVTTARDLLAEMAPRELERDCGTLAALAEGVRALQAWTSYRTGGRQ